MGEGELREVKQGVGRQMLCSGCPTILWGDCIIREAYVLSHTAPAIFCLEGQVPDSKVIDEPLGISKIAYYA
jgi:hypothetical protein